MSDDWTWEVNFGSVELVTCEKFEDGVLYLGGYSIERDRDGVETSRTEPIYNMTVTYDILPERSFFQRIIDLF